MSSLNRNDRCRSLIGYQQDGFAYLTNELISVNGRGYTQEKCSPFLQGLPKRDPQQISYVYGTAKELGTSMLH